MDTEAQVTALAGGIARIRGATGQVAGCGFVFGTNLVCTCAHVITTAVGGDPHDIRPPAGPAVVEFPLLTGCPSVLADIDPAGWRPIRTDDGGDVAVLRLRDTVPGVHALPLVTAAELWQHSVRAFGFPERHSDGLWVAAALRAAQGTGWIQMEVAADGPRIGPGFSGSPVWDEDLRGVIGMTVAAQSGSTTAFLLPATEIADVHGVPGCPYRGLEPFLERHAMLFYGREAETSRLAAAVAANPIVAITGPSGSGKSSLVRAGLLPRLREQGTAVAEFRPLPGISPAAVLAYALVNVLEPGLGDIDEVVQAGKLTQLLVDDTPDTIRMLSAQLLDRTGSLLLFGDQFEEIVSADPPAARRLLDLVVRLVTTNHDRGFGLRAALTLRSSSLDELLTPDSAELLGQGTVLIAPMNQVQLRAAITQPAKGVTGASFEAGLVDRIVHDAARQPGQLPLVQFALTTLWDLGDGVLTHQAYEGLGGVSGALARYADGIYLNTLTPDEQNAARRLLTQLARPDDSAPTGFSRCPMRMTDLGADLKPVLDKLATTRLVVTDQIVGHAEVVELTHQALVERWGRLRDWLADSRDFRRWQEELRQSVGQWEATGRDRGGLLRGTRLAVAIEWLSTHTADISAPERAYVRRSVRRRRMGWISTFAIVLTVIAVLSAATFMIVDRNAQLGRDLRTSDAQFMAGEAEHLFESDPITALQLTLAAWHNAKDEPVTRNLLAYEALLREYVALRSADRIISGYWQSYLSDFRTSDDGSTMVMNTGGGTIVLTDLPGARPQSWKVSDNPSLNFALSADGRLLVTSGGRGDITLWNVARRSQVRNLTTAYPTRYRYLSFSADDNRLLSLTDSNEPTTEHHLEIWSLPDGTPVAHKISLASGSNVGTVEFVNSNTVVTTGYPTDGESARSQLIVQELNGTTRQLFSMENAATLVQHGTALAYDGDDGFVHVRDLMTGGDRVTGLKDQGEGVRIDATGNYAMDWNFGFHNGADTYRTLTVMDLRTTAIYQVVAPNWGTDNEWTDTTLQTVAVVPRPGGGIFVYLGEGTSLVRLHADQPDAVHYDKSPPFDPYNTQDQINCPSDVPMDSVGGYVYERTLIGVTADGLRVDILKPSGLCSLSYHDSGLEFLGGTSGIPIANVELPGTVASATMHSVGSVSQLDIVFDTTSTDSSSDERKTLSLPLNPELWFRQLCGVWHGELGQNARNRMPQDAETDPPCQ